MVRRRSKQRWRTQSRSERCVRTCLRRDEVRTMGQQQNKYEGVLLRANGSYHEIYQEIEREQSVVYVIDDNADVRDAISLLLRSVGIPAETFGSTKEFLRSKRSDVPGCLILDVRLPQISGLDFQIELGKLSITLPVIFVSAHADVAMGVRAMKAGAVEFLCKPFRDRTCWKRYTPPSPKTYRTGPSCRRSQPSNIAMKP